MHVHIIHQLKRSAPQRCCNPSLKYTPIPTPRWWSMWQCMIHRPGRTTTTAGTGKQTAADQLLCCVRRRAHSHTVGSTVAGQRQWSSLDCQLQTVHVDKAATHSAQHTYIWYAAQRQCLLTTRAPISSHRPQARYSTWIVCDESEHGPAVVWHQGSVTNSGGTQRLPIVPDYTSRTHQCSILHRKLTYTSFNFQPRSAVSNESYSNSTCSSGQLQC